MKMKIAKCLLISTFFISAVSFADTPIQEEVTLPSIIDVVSFCSSDKNCISIVPVIEESELNYDVKYETTPIATDPTEEQDDD
jgi:hypothetical protein